MDKLLRQGIDFVASDVVESPFGSNVNYVRANILDFKSVCKLVSQADVIVHFAASTLLSSLEKPRSDMKINVEGTLNIMDASREYKIDKLIFSSASSVVGDIQYSPVDEKHPCNPKTPYAVAKKACEDYLRVYKEIFDLDYLIFRFFNVYGPWQYPQSKALVPTIFDRLSLRKAFDIYGDGTATRDFVFVEDVADFCCQAVQENIKNEIVNMGTGKPTSIMDLVNLAANILGVKPKLVFKPARPGEVSNFVADTAKLEKLFGRKPSTSLRTGLERTFDWLRSLPNSHLQKSKRIDAVESDV